jgi:hypothetical protein
VSRPLKASPEPRWWTGITWGHDARCFGCTWAHGPGRVYQVKARHRDCPVHLPGRREPPVRDTWT